MFQRIKNLIFGKSKPKNNDPIDFFESYAQPSHYIINTMLHFMKLNIELIYMSHGIRKEISFDPIDNFPYESPIGVWRNFRNVSQKAFNDCVKELQKSSLN